LCNVCTVEPSELTKLDLEMQNARCISVPIIGEDPSCSFCPFKEDRGKDRESQRFHYDVIMSSWLQAFRKVFDGLFRLWICLDRTQSVSADPAQSHAAAVPGHGMATTEWVVRMHQRTCTGPYLLQRRDRESNPKLHEDVFRAPAVC
jgi:hypothetical protein